MRLSLAPRSRWGEGWSRAHIIFIIFSVSYRIIACDGCGAAPSASRSSASSAGAGGSSNGRPMVVTRATAALGGWVGFWVGGGWGGLSLASIITGREKREQREERRERAESREKRESRELLGSYE